MNDRSAKPRQAKVVAEKGRPQSGEYPRTSNVDEEFHEFFNQGDVGEYEGGVAYSQPPSRLLSEIEDEQIVIADPALQRARRAFFGRVVAIIVTACVILLVTAAKFGPQDTGRAKANDSRHASPQYAAPEEVKLSPPIEPIRAVPVVPAVVAAASVAPQAPAEAPSPTAANQPQVPAPAEKATASKGTEGTKIADAPTAETARTQAKQLPSTTIPVAKASSSSGMPAKLAQKSRAVATREAPPPTSGVTKPAKDSVGAFPVD